MELWERSAALDDLDAQLRAGRAGGRVVLVAGAAGLGKTALVSAFAARVPAGVRVLRGGCDPLETPLALGPLHEVARQAGGDLAEVVGRTDVGTQTLFTASLEALARGGGAPGGGVGTVLVLEDVHWADEATLDWLAYLGRRVQRVPVLLVLTYRDDEVGPLHPLRRTLAALPAAAVRRVGLDALSRACVSEQAVRAGRDADQVWRLAGGNPLLVTELLEADPGVVPAAAQDLVLDRLRTLPASARELARLVSVVPTRADPELLRGHEQDVETCVHAGVLVPVGDGVAYRHELLRSAVEASLLPARRAALHARVLELLTGLDGVDPGRLVHHARLAGDDDAVLRFGRAAGAGAARQGAHREAAAHYRAAAPFAARLPAAEHADLLERLSTEAYLGGLAEEALRARTEALLLRERLGVPERIGEDLRWISRLAWWTGRGAESAEAAARAVAVLEDGPPTRELAMACSNRSHVHVLRNQFDEAIAWGARARELADLLGDEETALHAGVNELTARLVQGDLEAAGGLERLHRRAADAGFVDHAARAINNAATVLPDELGRYGAAVPLLDRALEYAEEHDLEGYVLSVLGARARVRFERGEWAEALADADTVLEHGGRHGVNAVLPLVVRGRVASARGEPDAELLLDAAAGEADRVGDAQYVTPVAEARSEHHLREGDPARAAAEARRGLALVTSVHGQPVVVGRLAHRLWQAGGTVPAGLVVARPYRLLMAGDWRGAAAEWERLGAPYLRAEALAHGDRAAATEALRVLDHLGAVRAAARLRARMRSRGLGPVPRGPAPATRAHPAGLTARQVEVLELLTTGATNVEIARRLVLSVRTVDHHVSAVLAKLGAATRGEAVALAERLGL